MSVPAWIDSPSTTMMISAVFVVVQGLAILSAFHALWYVRTTQAAIAWVVGLLAMPIVALPMYWVFGRYRFHGYRESIRAVGQKHKRSVKAVHDELRTARNRRTTALETPIEYLADVLDTPICDGNVCELLVDGDRFFDALIESIDHAKRYVYVEFYIVRDDSTGRRLADALCRAAQRDVTVRFLYDEIGSLRLSSQYIDRMTEAGVEMRSFNTRRGLPNRFQLNFRNHRKICVIDGQTGLVGGLNVGDEYLGKANWTDHWRDTAMQFRGPLVNKVQAVFAGDYYWAARRDLPEADWSEAVAAGPARAAVCATGPADDRPQASMMFAAIAASARDRLWISSPYLVPDSTCMLALTMARARDVDVRILAPSIPDAWTVFLAGFHYERELSAAGIPVYRYAHGAMHQKCILVDHQLALIGSTNLDNRSLHLNFELMVAVEEPEFVDSVAEMLQRDFDQSEIGTSDGMTKHPWKTRVGRIMARLFSPVL